MATVKPCGLGSPTNNLCHQQFYQNTRCWIDLSNTRKSARRVNGYEFQTLQKFLIGATVAFCATAGIPSDPFRAVLAALALVSAGLAYTLNQNEKNFVFIDHVQAEFD